MRGTVPYGKVSRLQTSRTRSNAHDIEYNWCIGGINYCRARFAAIQQASEKSNMRAREEYRPIPAGQAFGWIGGVAVVFALITMWLGAFTTAQYERDIVTRYGAFHRIAQPGFNVKMPWVDGLETVDMRVASHKFENMEAYSSDQQIAKLDVSVTYRAREAKLEMLFNNFRNVEGFVNNVLARYVPADTKTVFGDYTAVSAIKDRDKLNMDVKTKIISHLGVDPVVEIVSVNVEDIEFSKAYNSYVEDNMKAEVEVRKAKNTWDQEKVKADIIKTQADAQAYKIKAQGDAEAAAIEAKSKALANNPRYVEMMQAEKWDGKLPQTVLPTTTAVPFINGVLGAR